MCTTSMGSSIVTMCERRVELMCPIIAAIVVVFPVPAGPVTRTSPRGDEMRSVTACGSRSSSKEGASARTLRSASETSRQDRSRILAICWAWAIGASTRYRPR